MEKTKKEGRVFSLSNGTQMCNECCNGDRCDDPSHYHRNSCPYCLGTGYNLTADNHNKLRELENTILSYHQALNAIAESKSIKVSQSIAKNALEINKLDEYRRKNTGT